MRVSCLCLSLSLTECVWLWVNLCLSGCVWFSVSVCVCVSVLWLSVSPSFWVSLSRLSASGCFSDYVRLCLPIWVFCLSFSLFDSGCLCVSVSRSLSVAVVAVSECVIALLCVTECVSESDHPCVYVRAAQLFVEYIHARRQRVSSYSRCMFRFSLRLRKKLVVQCLVWRATF